MTKNWSILLLAALAVFGSILYSLTAVAIPFLLGLIGAYAFNGFVTRLERFKISRGISSGIIIFGVISLLILLIIFAFPYLQQHLIQFALSVPELVDSLFGHLRPTLEQFSTQFGTPAPSALKEQVTSHLGEILTWSIRLVTNILSNGMAFASIVSLVILTPMVMFYMLKDWPLLVTTVDNLIPLEYQETIRRYAIRVDTTLSEYARGQATVCFILMNIYAFSLWGIGLPQGFLIGLLTGFLSFIPYVGAIIGLFACLALAITTLDPTLFGRIFIVFICANLVESNILSPRLIGGKIGLHPVWIIFSLLAGATWFGFIGILLALPIAAIIGVIVRIVIEWYRSTPIYTHKETPLCNDFSSSS